MNTIQFEKILLAHGVQFKTENSQLFALEEWCNKDGSEGSQWINVTDWTLTRLKHFLGY